MIDNQVQAADKQSSKNARHLRIAGIVILVAVLGYTVALLAGLPKERRLDATALGVIGIGSLVATLLFRPDIVDRVTRLEIAGWKVEIEKKEQKQDKQLFDIELILAILLPETERRHLMNLAGKRTTEYMGSHEMRSELRRLRSIGLIETKPGHTVGSMGDKTKLDLSEYVQLTDLGRRLVQNISDIEAQTASEAKASQVSWALLQVTNRSLADTLFGGVLQTLTDKIQEVGRNPSQILAALNAFAARQQNRHCSATWPRWLTQT